MLAERPAGRQEALALVLNGLGATKYEELFVLWTTVSTLLKDAGLEVIAPEAGEFVTSLDMQGCSLTLLWLDDELETLLVGRLRHAGSAPWRDVRDRTGNGCDLR